MKAEQTLFYCKIIDFRHNTQQITALLMSQDYTGSFSLPLSCAAILPHHNMEVNSLLPAQHTHIPHGRAGTHANCAN